MATDLDCEFNGVRLLRIDLSCWDEIWDDVKFLFDNLTLTLGRNLEFETSEDRKPFQIQNGTFLLYANNHDCRDKRWMTTFTKKIKTPLDLYNKLKKECYLGMFLKLKVIQYFSLDFDKHLGHKVNDFFVYIEYLWL